MNAKSRKRAGVSKHMSGSVGKTVVMGMLERGGKVVAKVLKTRKRNELLPPIIRTVKPDTTIYTDEYASYDGLGKPRYEHETINHVISYVDGQIHTNGIENFWSLLKRGLRGTYVSVEPFHLFRYLDEQMFRFNERELTDQGRFMLALRRIGGKRLTYKGLIGADLEAHSAA